MDKIYDKINNHEFLNNDDIKHIVNVLSKGKIKTTFLEDFPHDMAYRNSDHSVLVNAKIKSINIKYFIDFTDAKLKVIDQDYKSNFLVDLYNIYLLNGIFHELSHANQFKRISSNLSIKTKLIKENMFFAETSLKLYRKNHDLYYHEYDAIIKSLIMTLRVIDEKCKGLDKNAIIQFNRFIAGLIYHSYGNRYDEGNELKGYNRFKAPICYTRHLASRWCSPSKIEKVKEYIQLLKQESTDEYMKLVNGLELSKETNKLILDVYNGSKITENLLDEVEQLGRVKVKVK